ncbi:MAG TPA: histidine kinase dimerization/phospho-acceptor domain-containing protein, partial [Rubrivivax sp.]|nr:histidine kinase dimerization/phospho-acceptor domain-containing protein [Rubrivivax sp.]
EWARVAGVPIDELKAWGALLSSRLPAEGVAARDRQLGAHRLRCVPVRLAAETLSPVAGAGEPSPAATAAGEAVLWWLQPQATQHGQHEQRSPEERVAQARRATEFLDRALVMAGVSAWRLDPATHRIHFNAVGFRTIGITQDPAGIDLDTMRATIHPEDRDAVVDAAQQAMASDRVVDAVARYRNPDGSWRTLLTRRIAERDEAGRAFGLAGVSIDLTPLLAERERNQVLTDRARLVADALGVGFWSRDLETGIGCWDEQLYRIHARPRELGAPVGEQWISACVHPQDQQRIARLVRQGDANFEPLTEAVFRMHDHGGQARWARTWACRTRRGDRRMIYGMTLDITERRAAEAAHAEKKRLEQASRDKSAFMARMSHELRTPMNAVLGFAQLMESDTQHPLSERQRERLTHIAGAGGQLMLLIDDLLETAQREPPPPAAKPAAGLHVLCVEDNPVNLQLVRELIALRPQVRLRTAVDGLSGVQAALTERPDLLLLDLQLPDIDGLEVMRRLRADASMAGLRIVALSADAMPDH